MKDNPEIHYDAKTYWSDLLAKELSAKGVCYPEWPLSYNRFLHQQQVEVLDEILRRCSISLKGKSILEIGPGSGFWTHFFKQQKVANYTGIDISQEAIDRLKSEFGNFNFICQDVGITGTIPVNLIEADIVFAAMVLLHITDDRKFEDAFSFLAQHLKPGGYFILLDAIATKHVFGAMRREAEGADFDPTFHNKIRYATTLYTLAAKNDLEIVLIRPAFNISQKCFDFKTYFGYLMWGKLFFAIHRRILNGAGERTGFIYAAVMRVKDYMMTRILRLGMSGKWVLFRKKVQ